MPGRGSSTASPVQPRPSPCYLNQVFLRGDGVGARGTAAWPDHAPGMLLPFPRGCHPPAMAGTPPAQCPALQRGPAWSPGPPPAMQGPSPSAGAEQGRWGPTCCGFTCVTPGRGSGGGPLGQGAGVLPPLALFCLGCFPARRAAAVAAPLEAQQSLLPARACSQGYI